MSTAVPATLGGRYEIGALLGRGGMAEVHVGQDVRLGRTVAVKMLRPDMARDPSFQARFRREAHSAASLNHPSIVAVYDTGEDTFDGNPVPYIVMEYVDGSTLRELLASGSRLVPERALEIVDGVLNALAYSHQQGIIHRDIKPGNVMLTREGHVKVMDFGIARAMADMGATMTQTSAVIGTAQYLSPEQARGEQVDARSDLYSTGCLLYELLTGRPPFAGDSPVSVAVQHVRDEPAPPSQVDPDLPRSLDAVVLKSLAKNREDRYQTAAQMRGDIASVLAGRAVTPPPRGATRPAEHTSVLPGAGPAATAVGSAAMFSDDHDDRRREGRAGRGLAYALLAIAVLSLFIIAAVFGRELLAGNGEQTIRVPDLTGKTVAEAKDLLRDRGLRLGPTQEVSNDRYPEGAIVDQDPQPGIEVNARDRVSVDVSTGKEMVEVPRVVSLPIDEANRTLTEAGLRLGEPREVLSDKEEGIVVRQRPKANESVEVGTEIVLNVASGNNEVPDLSGLTEAEARQKIQAAGFTYGGATPRETPDAEPGTVIDQSEGAKSELPLDSPISITVAVTPPTPEPTDTPSPTDTSTTTPPPA